MAMISINSLYNYDSRVFEKFNVPTGMNKADVINNICFECAELSLIYTDPVFMKNAIGLWSRKEQAIWEKLFATENFDYNPIWNVDGTVIERETNSRDRSGQRDKSGSIQRQSSDQENMTGTQLETTATDDVRTGSNSSEDVKSVTGYNSTSWQAHEKDEVSGSSNNRADIDVERNLTETKQTTGTGTENVSDTENIRDNENEQGSRDLETVRTGNIGVTTTQQMIREEREVDTFNTIDYITQSFKRRFCIMVY